MKNRIPLVISITSLIVSIFVYYIVTNKQKCVQANTTDSIKLYEVNNEIYGCLKTYDFNITTKECVKKYRIKDK